MGWLWLLAAAAGWYAFGGTLTGVITYRKVRGMPAAASTAWTLGAVWPLVPVLALIVRRRR